MTSGDNDGAPTTGAPGRKKGGRPSTGAVVRIKTGPHAGQLQGIIRLFDGSKKRLEPFDKGTSQAMAEERTKFWQEKVLRERIVKEPKNSAASAGAEWWESYFKWRDARGLSPTRPAYNSHVKPVIGDKHPRQWTRSDCEAIVAELDKKVTAGGITWKTAANCWGFFTKACRVASSAKSATGLKVRDDNPAAGVEGPDRGAKKKKQWLTPNEFAQLVACEEVPIRWRRMYAFLAYAYIRPSELKALDPSDVKLGAGVIEVTKAWDRHRNKRKLPKTDAGVREVPIEPTLRPLLEALLAEHDGEGPLFPMPAAEAWAATFRKHLERAEIDRAELYVDTLAHKQITMYDLRASGITWRCLRKDHGPEIQRDAGHEKYDTTDGYIRKARSAGNVGAPFPPLPPSLLGRSLDRANRSRGGLEEENPGKTGVSERPQRDLNRPSDATSHGNYRGSGEVGPPETDPDSGANPAFSGARSNRVIQTERDPVEVALAAALERASAAGEWAAVEALARELAARRLAHAAPNVSNISQARARKENRS